MLLNKFLDHHSNLADAQKNGLFIAQHTGLTYSDDGADWALDLLVEKDSKQTSTHFPSSQLKEQLRVHVSPKMWSVLRGNQSDLYLHAVLIPENLEGPPITAVSRAEIESGRVLYGMVQMVKYDVIPTYFRHRLLLSDFGLAQMSEINSEF